MWKREGMGVVVVVDGDDLEPLCQQQGKDDM